MNKICLVDFFFTILSDIIGDSVVADCDYGPQVNSFHADMMQLSNDGQPPIYEYYCPYSSLLSQRACCEMCKLLCCFKNSLASLRGKIHWITQKEMQLLAPSRILITEA